ncbi:hypothetical protein CCH79_00011381 [Gambusia affinis]|uniref:CUB domain-containing protein n=1 Tax=Gambusia affinis TaxID=33528 RepID=A0A315VEC9_GAMAF|nr:hypothetical protein CCH79_00011381 [Gambusia affinis]
MAYKLLLPIAIAASLIPPELCGSTANTKKAQVENNSGVTPAGQCGTWVKEPSGGCFTSPNYPEKYPPERECVYIIEGETQRLSHPAADLPSHFLIGPSPAASPRQCIDLFFDEKYSIEPSWECRFDHIEIRDGPFAFSPIIGRYCGQESPAYVRSSGRYLYIKFVADGELEAIGFSARYNFTQDPEFEEIGELPALPACDFELSGPEGFVESTQIAKEGKAQLTEAVDCRWYIRAPPRAKSFSSLVCLLPNPPRPLLPQIYMRFLEYEMHNSNECKRNFVAIYDGSSGVEHLKNKFCSTVANDVMLVTSVGVVRLWADEGSRKSRFKILFTTFHEHDFDPALLHPGFEPPHYELCTLRRAPSGDLTDGALADDFDKFHKLRRSESKCIRDHHCGSHQGSIHGSRSNLSLRDATIAPDGGAAVPPMSPRLAKQMSPHLSHHNTPAGRRSILVMKHSYSQDGAEAYRAEDEDEDLMMDVGPTTSQHYMHHHHIHHSTPGLDRTLSNDF